MSSDTDPVDKARQVLSAAGYIDTTPPASTCDNCAHLGIANDVYAHDGTLPVCNIISELAGKKVVVQYGGTCLLFKAGENGDAVLPKDPKEVYWACWPGGSNE